MIQTVATLYLLRHYNLLCNTCTRGNLYLLDVLESEFMNLVQSAISGMLRWHL